MRVAVPTKLLLRISTIHGVTGTTRANGGTGCPITAGSFGMGMPGPPTFHGPTPLSQITAVVTTITGITAATTITDRVIERAIVATTTATGALGRARPLAEQSAERLAAGKAQISARQSVAPSEVIAATGMDAEATVVVADAVVTGMMMMM